jgi:hypothetical protein
MKIVVYCDACEAGPNVPQCPECIRVGVIVKAAAELGFAVEAAIPRFVETMRGAQTPAVEEE